MSVIILGNTETTTSSSSSGYAQSKEHSKQQLEITKSDLVDVEAELNSEQFLNILAWYGYPVEGGSFEYEKEIDLDSLKIRMEIDEKVSGKVPVGDDYWYETYGIPKPDNYDQLKAEQAALQNQLNNPKEDDPEENDPNKKPSKPVKPPVKKNLNGKSLWYGLRSIIADFFDPAP